MQIQPEDYFKIDIELATSEENKNKLRDDSKMDIDSPANL